MSVKFRSRKKEGIEIQVPPEIAEEVRTRAARERRSISEVGTEILLTGLRWNHGEFGITVLKETTNAETTV